MSAGRIALAMLATSAASATSAAQAADDRFAYTLAVTPEEGPIDRAVEVRYTRAFQTCQAGAVTTLHNARCFAAEYVRQDAALNAVWPRALAGQAAALRQPLRAAQRRWLARRDPFCRSYVQEFAGGTIMQVIAWSCPVELTIRRTIWLEGLARGSRP